MEELTNIRINKNVNFSDIENLAKKIISDKPSKMQIPNKLSHSGGFGLEGAVLQLFATWLRNSENHIIHTSVQNSASDNFSDLCNHLFGLCALRLSDSVLLSNKQEVDLVTALKPAIPIFKELRAENFKNAFKGMYLTIPSIKAALVKGSHDREFDNPLYNNHEVVGAQKFHHLTMEALQVIEPNLSDIDPTLITHISEILRELFTNTHRHARTDVYGNPISKNFRGLIFNSLTLEKERLEEISKSGGGPLTKFFAEWLPEGNQKFHAIDITIVDSGPGFARRWHKLDKDKLTIEQEKEAIIECFTKHKSTDKADSSGSGLSNVLSDLKSLKGWFRLRTGRTLVEKSFFHREGNTIIENKDIKTRDVFMEGATFNIVIPLRSLRGDK